MIKNDSSRLSVDNLRAPLVIGRADRPGYNRRRTRTETDRNAGHDHEYREAETECCEFGVTDPADEPGVDETLRHHRRDAEEYGHSHVDEVPTDRALGKSRFGGSHSARVSSGRELERGKTMKFRFEVLIDASLESIWKIIDDQEGPGIPIIESVTERREPHFLAGTSETPTGIAVVVNHFEAMDANKTRWSIYANHTFKGIYRVLGMFYTNSIRKSSEETMNNFKLFAETEQAQHAK